MRPALIVVVLLILAPAWPARARQTASVEDLAARLEAQTELIRALQARVEELEARLEPAPQPSAASTVAVAPAASPTPVAPASRPADDWTARAGGRIDVDAWAADGAPSGALVRRARLSFNGGRADGPAYAFSAELSSGSVNVLNAYVDLPLTDDARARIGRHRIPFSLTGQTSESYSQFLERPVGLEAFIPNWANGASLVLTERNWSLEAGVFARNGEGEDDDLALGGRLAWAPLRRGGRYLHLGAAANRTWFADDGAARLRQRPEQRLAAYALDTGLVPADHQDTLGLEVAYSAGPWGLVAEGAAQAVDRLSGDRLVHAGYVLEGWWTLTGEARPYRVEGGVFSRVQPFRPTDAGGTGAWQLVARYSGLDLDDDVSPTGRIEAAALGLNWYLTERLKFMLDLSRSNTWTEGTTVRRSAVGARVHVDW